MGPDTDEELVSQYRAHAGSPQGESALNELFQRHHRKVALWCLRLTGDREAAADMAQDVFLKAFRYLDSFRGESKFSTWLYTVTRNHCYNEIKVRASAPEQIDDFDLSLFADQTPGAHTQMEREHSAGVLQQLVNESLNELETQVVTLHYVEELPLDAVTRMLGLENASGAKAHIVSARRKLARAMDRWKARSKP